MILSLPPRSDERTAQLDTLHSHNITVIGANGSGKTRFADRIAKDLGPEAIRLSAIQALYVDTDSQSAKKGFITNLYHKAVADETSLLRQDLKKEFEQLLALLVGEEIVNLMTDKYAPEEHRKHRPTRLEKVMRNWQKLFPDNHVLMHQGEILFERQGHENDRYSASRLSDGEKAVLYHLGATAFAPQNATIIVDSPSMFLHPSIIAPLWDSVERMRPDCLFIYLTHDLQFASSKSQGPIVWVKHCDTLHGTWDYEIMSAEDALTDELYLAILGDRRPVLFIEGDGKNSIDAKLYPLIFNEYTVKSLGGCDRVIESTRTFNNLRTFHNLNAQGIVDRDRRDSMEVEYLRKRQILVPEVAEIENIFMLEDVLKTLAIANGRDPEEAFQRIKTTLFHLFKADLHQQALQHTRHKVKRIVEHRIDARFANIKQLETHMKLLPEEVNPRGLYNKLCSDFNRYLKEENYNAILRVYNRKSMLTETHAASIVGLKRDDKESLVRAVLYHLQNETPHAESLRTAIRKVF